jgi:hypothetical protein
MKSRNVWKRILLSALILFAGIMQAAEALHMSNPYKSLDDRARDAKTFQSTQALVREIYARTLFGGELAPSLLLRVTRSEECTTSCLGITENDVTAAVNMLGKELDPTNYTGTNVQQVRLLRVAMFGDLPHLLKSPTRPPDGKIIGSDMTPAGAFFLALTLLRQKISNPAWFGDPDKQNTEWVTRPRTTLNKEHNQVYSRVRVESELPRVTKIRQALVTGLANDRSPLASVFNRFLDVLHMS